MNPTINGIILRIPLCYAYFCDVYCGNSEHNLISVCSCMCGERKTTKRYVRLVINFPLILLCCYFIDLSGNKTVQNTDTQNICSLCIKIKNKAFSEQQNRFGNKINQFERK